jgi:phytoene desaturase
VTLFSLWRIDPFRTVHQAVSSFFNDPRLVQLFDRYATYNGSNPYRAPATLNVIPHVEFTLGGFYPKGGVAQLARVMAALAQRRGVTIHRNADVDSILIEGQRAAGIRLRDGRDVRADAVISNADAVHTLTRMLGEEGERYRRYAELEPSSSGLVFLWGIRGEHSGLAHHNIFFSSDYRREFEELFDRRVPPSDPTTYVAVTSKTDPDHAPRGHENWFVLINMPSTEPGTPPPDRAAVRAQVLAKLARHGFDVRGKIVAERMIGPEEFERRFNANRGSIYGLSSNSRASAFLRPRNRVRGIRGLYLCGGSAHPGGGIPLVITSGRLAAEACLEDLRA